MNDSKINVRFHRDTNGCFFGKGRVTLTRSVGIAFMLGGLAACTSAPQAPQQVRFEQPSAPYAPAELQAPAASAHQAPPRTVAIRPAPAITAPPIPKPSALPVPAASSRSTTYIVDPLGRARSSSPSLAPTPRAPVQAAITAPALAPARLSAERVVPQASPSFAASPQPVRKFVAAPPTPVQTRSAPPVVQTQTAAPRSVAVASSVSNADPIVVAAASSQRDRLQYGPAPTPTMLEITPLDNDLFVQPKDPVARRFQVMPIEELPPPPILPANAAPKAPETAAEAAIAKAPVSARTRSSSVPRQKPSAGNTDEIKAATLRSALGQSQAPARSTPVQGSGDPLRIPVTNNLLYSKRPTPPTIEYNIPHLPQEEPLWCWAAAAQQAIGWVNNGKAPAQCAIVALAHGIPVKDCCADREGICARTGEIPAITKLIQRFGGYGEEIAVPRDPELVYRILRNGNTLLIRLRPAPHDEAIGIRHMIVVRGIEWLRLPNNQLQATLLYNDPLGDGYRAVNFNEIEGFFEQALLVKRLR